MALGTRITRPLGARHPVIQGGMSELAVPNSLPPSRMQAASAF